MLCLSRTPSERVLIRTKAGEVIEVVVLSIDRNQARLGFVADRSIDIMREELVRPPHSAA